MKKVLNILKNLIINIIDFTIFYALLMLSLILTICLIELGKLSFLVSILVWIGLTAIAFKISCKLTNEKRE